MRENENTSDECQAAIQLIERSQNQHDISEGWKQLKRLGVLLLLFKKEGCAKHPQKGGYRPTLAFISP